MGRDANRDERDVQDQLVYLLRGGQPNSSGLLLPWGQEPYVPEPAREEAGCPGCGTCGALPGGDCEARDAGTTNEPLGDGSATGSATAITLLEGSSAAKGKAEGRQEGNREADEASGGARGLGTAHLTSLEASGAAGVDTRPDGDGGLARCGAPGGGERPSQQGIEELALRCALFLGSGSQVRRQQRGLGPGFFWEPYGIALGPRSV